MAGQRSVAFISGMICSADNKLAKDMQTAAWERKLIACPWDDKRDLGPEKHAGIRGAFRPGLA